MSKLDIGVTLQAKGNTLKDGVWFSYYPLATSDATAKGYLKDAAGNIDIPGGGQNPVQITFHLATKQLTVGGTTYTASFQLADSAGARETLAIKQGISDPKEDIFDPPKLDSSGGVGSVKDQVFTSSLKRDDVTYDYKLKVGLTPAGGRTTNVGHDPKIKNGGTASRWGADEVLIVVAAFVLGMGSTLVFPRLMKFVLQLFR